MCENCKNLFDIKNNLPYLIPCGHTLCEKCMNLLEFKNNKMKCPICSKIYEISKENIPKNEMVIDYIQTYKIGPKYSYQIREYVIEEATFCHIDRRNCCQKLCHFLYILIYVKIILTIINIILWPFKKIYQLIKQFFILIYGIYLKIKEFIIKIFNKIISIHLPKLNINCQYFVKLKNKLFQTKLSKAIIKFFKYTIRAPLWINYLKIMKNLLYESQSKVKNKCIKVVNVIITLMGILLAHFVSYFTSNLANFLIIILLLNESTIVLLELMKMEDEKKNKMYLNKNNVNKIIAENNKRKSEDGIIAKKMFDEIEDEYFNDENKYNRGKKCILRWIGFLLFWYFFPVLSNGIFQSIKYLEFTKDIDIDSQEKNIQIWTGVLTSLLAIAKILIVIYLTY